MGIWIMSLALAMMLSTSCEGMLRGNTDVDSVRPLVEFSLTDGATGADLAPRDAGPRHDGRLPGLDSTSLDSTPLADQGGAVIPGNWQQIAAGTFEMGSPVEGNSAETTHPVAQKAPNALGLYDMAGNVFEWCNDWFADYPTSNITDPSGPTSGSATRIQRGGSWKRASPATRAASHNRYWPDYRSWDIGFRCARTLTP